MTTAAALAAIAATIAPWLFSPAALMDAVADQLQGSSGLYVAARGKTSFSLFPRPSIAVDRVAFADRNGALIIESSELHGDVDVLPLLAGRLKVAAVKLVRPHARIDFDKTPDGAPGAAARAAAAKPATLEAAAADNVRFGTVSIVDGDARVSYRGRLYALKRIDAKFEWRRIGEAAALSGAFDLNGERLEALLWVARPGALLRGEESVVTSRLDGQTIRFEAQGVGQLGANARFAGHVAAAASSARRALALFGEAAPLPGPFNDTQFSAQATLSTGEAHLKDARLFVDGNEFRGDFDLHKEDGRPTLAVALKSEFLSLRPFLYDAPPLVDSDGQWSGRPFELPDLSGADVDLRLAVGHARLGRLKISDASITATLRDGAAELSIDQAQAYRGAFKFRASVAPGPEGLVFHANAQTITAVDAGPLLWDAYGKPLLAGALNATLAVDGVGESMSALVRSLNGRAGVALVDGEISGVNLEKALQRLEKRPLSSAVDIRSGRSIVDAASAAIKFENGVAMISEGNVRGPGFSVAFSGSAPLPKRALAISAVARAAGAAGKIGESAPSIDFDVAGRWDELALKLDTQAFIRRSDAAAPLLPRADAPPSAPQAPLAPAGR
ncbi:MAG: AsmA family protein [Methylocystis sp.]|uniref:AsmA family protein n=1 Tax=Methylocystis sp. TaxID=1911079 RepID=UPI00394B6D40